MQIAQAGTEFVTTADGAQLRCVYAGEGPAVVLAHGYLLELEVYARVFPRLVAAGHRVIAFDQRAHGRSTVRPHGCTAALAASDYRSLLEHFGVQEGILVAHSMGAFLALRCCLEHPAAVRRLRRLVLLGANAGAVAKGSLQNQLQLPLLRSGLMKPLWRFPPIGRALVAQLFGRSPDPADIERTRAMLLRQDLETTLPLLQAMCHDDYYARLGEIPLETTVLCGELDRTCPAWHSQQLAAALPRATARWLPDRGHMLMLEAPDAIVEAVRSQPWAAGSREASSFA